MTDKNQAIRDVVKGAGIVYVGLLLELVIAFVAQVIAARYLSVGGFGGLTAGTALLDVGSIAASLGVGAGLTRYLPRVSHGEKRQLVTLAVGVTFVTSLVLGAVVSIAAPFIATTIFSSPGVTPSIRIFGAAIPFATMLNVAMGGIRGQEQSLYHVVVKNIAHPLARFAFVILAVTWGLEQAGIAGAYALPYVLSAAVGLVLLYRSLPPSSTSLDRGVVSEISRYSLPFTLTQMTGFIYRSIDIFIILYFLGDDATGIYGVAYAAVSFMGMFSTAFNYLSSPIASRLEKDDNIEGVMELFQFTARWLVIASVCALVPLGVFATEFITVIYQSKYASGGPILALLAVGFAAKNVLNIHSPILEALGRSKTLSMNSVVAALSNVVLNVLFVPQFGILGAAVATAISFALRDGLASIQVYRALDRTPLTWQSLQPLTVAVPVFGILYLVQSAIPSTFFWLLSTTAVVSIVYLTVVLLVFGLSPTEVMIARSTQERLGIELEPVDRLISYLDNR